jgi:hypothetical protein
MVAPRDPRSWWYSAYVATQAMTLRLKGAFGCAAPGSREPRRCASRPSGFDPSRKGSDEPLAGAVGPGSRRRRRRYADPPAAALLTGLGAALGPHAAFGVAMLTRTGCLLSSEWTGSASAFVAKGTPARASHPNAACRLYEFVAFDFPATQDCPAEIGWELFGEPNFVTQLATGRTRPRQRPRRRSRSV